MFDSDWLPCLVVLGIWCIFMGFGLVVLFILGIWNMVYFYFFSWVYNVTILDVAYDQVTSPSIKIFIWYLTIITDLLPKCLIHILIKYHEYFSFCQSVLPEQRHVNCNECNMHSEYKITDSDSDTSYSLTSYRTQEPYHDLHSIIFLEEIRYFSNPFSTGFFEFHADYLVISLICLELNFFVLSDLKMANW